MYTVLPDFVPIKNDVYSSLLLLMFFAYTNCWEIRRVE